MIASRRGFLAALLAAPIAAKVLPMCCPTQTGVEHFIHSNVWPEVPGHVLYDTLWIYPDGRRVLVPYNPGKHECLELKDTSFEWLTEDECKARGLEYRG